ncbi:MAG: type I-B CRISPR-associated protein Cas5b [Candidatus Heimdallarchaeota archaeon]
MQVVVFEARSNFGHFRSFEATRGNYSFPFPPRTALLGLIGAILGIDRDGYWRKSHSLRQAKLALEILTPVRRMGLKVHFSRTREVTRIGKGADRVIFYFPNKPAHPEERGFITQVRLDLLQNPHYRIYFSGEKSIQTELAERLESHRYVFPPYFGHANLLASLSYIGTFPAQPVKPGIHEVSGIIPTSYLDLKDPRVDLGEFEIVYGVPVSYSHVDDLSIPKKGGFSEVRLESKGNFILQISESGQVTKAAYGENADLFSLKIHSNSYENTKSVNSSPISLAFWPKGDS